MVRSVVTILLDQRAKQVLQMAALETALRFTPTAIADRFLFLSPSASRFVTLTSRQSDFIAGEDPRDTLNITN